MNSEMPAREKQPQEELKMAQSYATITTELAEAAARLTNAGMMRGWSGQLSARFPQSNRYSIVIKRSGCSAGDPSAYCLVDSDGKHPKPADARPSLVTCVHCAIYASCPDVHAVIQCRGFYSDAVAAVLGEIPLSLETFWALKTAPIVFDASALRSDTYDQYVDKMAVEVSNALAKPEKGTTAVCIPFYGMWVIGGSASETAGRAFALEDTAKAAYLRLNLASSLGLSRPAFPDWFRDILQPVQRPTL